ncbi:MAG: hypothetical protein M3O15_07160, partial [Acidobacteriota bacterium]|nr:hypothetical protein [Acidobacteriota bacterium]
MKDFRVGTLLLTPEPGVREQLIASAVAIGEQLGQHRLLTPSGAPTWIGPVGYGTELNPLRLLQLGPHFYDGTTGVALFFAALARVEGGHSWHELALATVAPLRRKLIELTADPERAARRELRVGGLIGLGSFIYGLLRIGDLLDEPELAASAHDATALLTPERIAADRRVRVQTGSAGALLALLALHHRLPGPNRNGHTPLTLATACAHHLLAARVPSLEGLRVWSLSPGKPPLPGFSYGAAGICHALLCLYQVTGERDLLEAAREGLAFVRGLYSLEHRTWLDPRVLFQARYRLARGTWRDWWASGTSA